MESESQTPPTTATITDLRPEHIGSDIWIYRNAVPDDLCRRVMDRYDQTEDKLNPGSAYDNRECKFVALNGRSDWKDLDEELFSVVGRIMAHHYREYEYNLPFSDEGYEVCCYEPGEVARRHQDGTLSAGRVRLWSLIMYLNDCEGGEVVFTRQDISIKPEKGLVCVWPPHMSHPHKTLPSKDRRFMIVTWSGPQV